MTSPDQFTDLRRRLEAATDPEQWRALESAIAALEAQHVHLRFTGTQTGNVSLGNKEFQ